MREHHAGTDSACHRGGFAACTLRSEILTRGGGGGGEGADNIGGGGGGGGGAASCTGGRGPVVEDTSWSRTARVRERMLG